MLKPSKVAVIVLSKGNQLAAQMEVVRPWGRKGEDVFCYAVTLDVLLAASPSTCTSDWVMNFSG